MSGARRGVNRNTTNTTRPGQGRGVPFPTREDTPGPVVYRILFRRLAVVGSPAKTPLTALVCNFIMLNLHYVASC